METISKIQILCKYYILNWLETFTISHRLFSSADYLSGFMIFISLSSVLKILIDNVQDVHINVFLSFFYWTHSNFSFRQMCMGIFLVVILCLWTSIYVFVPSFVFFSARVFLVFSIFRCRLLWLDNNHRTYFESKVATEY